MLSALKEGCVFQLSWVSRQVVLQGALDTPPVKPFLWRSFLVYSTYWVGIWVREVIKCNRYMRWRFDIWLFFSRCAVAYFGRHLDMSLS